MLNDNTITDEERAAIEGKTIHTWLAAAMF